MVVAFSGWNDAGEAATGALDHLWSAWDAQRFATLDPEEFVDFTANRPRIRVEAGVVESLEWPETEFGWCAPGGPTAVVLVRGPEPHLRWRTYCAEVLEVAEALGCSSVLTLGAMLSDVPHTRPTPVFTNAPTADLVDAAALPTSQYDGPTGIPGVLHEQAHRAGFDSLSLWAAVPAYAAAVSSPAAMLALIEQAAAVIGVAVAVDGLAGSAEDYVEQFDQLCEDDDDTAEYVHRLEEAYDTESVHMGSAVELVEEVEKFLRDQ